MFCCEEKLVFPVYVSCQKLENSMDLLLKIDGDKSHYVYIKKILIDLCFTRQKIKTKNTFAKAVYSVLVAKMC